MNLIPISILSGVSIVRLLSCIVLIGATLISPGFLQAEITIPTVPVGFAGNSNDPGTGNLFGGVSYDYRIGTGEITIGQYTAFLNAVAVRDTYGLYSPSMATDLTIAGIAQSGAAGHYSYNVLGDPDRPITYVNWGDAARFCNWLQNGQPTGLQNSSTTEDGAYTLLGATLNDDLSAVTRNAGAQWFIPSENEWYKAAYFQPAALGGETDNYWAYPMQTNSTPFSDQPPGTTPDNTHVGNFYADDKTANGYNDGFAVTGSSVFDGNQSYLTSAGAYSLSPSFFGTFDQGGNVFEWTEQLITDTLRLSRGGSWNQGPNRTSATDRNNYSPSMLESPSIGFRVAAVPEPHTALLAVLAGAALLFARGTPRRIGHR